MKVIQINALPGENGVGDTIYGLGDDGLLYYWNAKDGAWLPAREE